MKELYRNESRCFGRKEVSKVNEVKVESCSSVRDGNRGNGRLAL